LERFSIVSHRNLFPETCLCLCSSFDKGNVSIRRNVSHKQKIEETYFCFVSRPWVWVFAAPVRVGFRFLFFKKPGFRLGFGFFQNVKKNWKFSGKIVMKKEKNLRKSFNSSNLLQSIELRWREKPWFHQKTNQNF
jgi:hypothetical protein